MFSPEMLSVSGNKAYDEHINGREPKVIDDYDELCALILKTQRSGKKPILVTGTVREQKSLQDDLRNTFKRCCFIVISQRLEGMMGTMRTFNDLTEMNLVKPGEDVVVVNTGSKTIQAQYFDATGNPVGPVYQIDKGINNGGIPPRDALDEMVKHFRETYNTPLKWCFTGSIHYTAPDDIKVADKTCASDVAWQSVIEGAYICDELTVSPSDKFIIIRSLRDSDDELHKPSPVPPIHDENGKRVALIIGDLGGGKYADVDSFGNTVGEVKFTAHADYANNANDWMAVIGLLTPIFNDM